MSVASVELLRAAASGDLKRLREILVQGADINGTTKANQTALMLAAAFKRIDIVEYLVLAGADVNVQDELGLSASDWARHDTRIIKLLDARLVVDDKSKSARPELADNTVAPSAVPVAPGSWSELRKTIRRVYLSLPHLSPGSPAFRTLFRVSIVVLLLVLGFGTYHFVTSRVSTRTSTGIKPDPTSLPVNAATKPIKSVPAVGGDLAGTDLFLPDAEYPPDATVASGTITVNIQVSRKGIVVNAEGLGGDASLRRAAEKAALASAFAPEKLKDKDLLIHGTITYSFLKPNNTVPPPAQEFGFSTDVSARSNVSASAGGPLAGAERKLVIPKIPKSVRVEQESATVVVRVNRAGRVMSWRPLEGDESFRAYLIKAARSSTFNPAKLSGEDQVVGFITYKFEY